MTVEDKINYAFVAGEVAPDFFGRSDLSKYEFGAAVVQNFFVSYKGGLVSRPGFEFVGYQYPAEGAGKLIRFIGTNEDFVLLFTDQKMRVIQNGGYVLETPKAISGATLADPCILTITSHGFSPGDDIYLDGIAGLIELNQRYFKVGAVTTHTIELQTIHGEALDATSYTGYDSGGTASRVYALTTPYLAEDLRELDWEQRYNTIRLSHISYSRRILTYSSPTNWALSTPTVGSKLPTPAKPTVVASATGAAGMAFAVTAVDAEGTESLPSAYGIIENSVNHTITSGSVTASTSGVNNAVSYNFYRSSVFPVGADVTIATQVGYIGSAFGPIFTDQNVIPDFTATPPVYLNPFANSTIQHVNVTAAGSGYDKSDTISISGGGGTGFSGHLIVDKTGAVIGVSIINGGRNYSSPTASISTSGGSGATFNIVVGPASGNNPALFRIFQQRGIYFSTENQPATLWASKPGSLDNYDVSDILNAGDSYSYTLDTVAVKPIKHATAFRQGLLLFTDDQILQLRGETGKAISAVNAIVEPQSYQGISDVKPIVLDTDVLIFSKDRKVLNAMLYTNYTNSFELQDVSVLSSHLFEKHGARNIIEVMAPNKLLYFVREDGQIVTLTYDRKQEVFGWARQTTYGKFKDCIAVQENGVTILYVLVERTLQGKTTTTIERAVTREDAVAEDYFGVDCGLRHPLTYPDAGLSCDTATGAGTMTASSSVFSEDNVGDIIYLAGGKFEVLAYVNETTLTGTWLRAASELVPEKPGAGKPLSAASGEWSCNTPVTEVTGLWHLEGETVSLLTDGDAYLAQMVEGGKISLPVPATKINVGLAYTCSYQSLPLASQQIVSEGRYKTIFKFLPRVKNTRGLEVGADFSRMVPLPDRSDEDWGEVLKLFSGTVSQLLQDDYEFDAFVCARQQYPLPATLLNHVSQIDVGDDG